MRHLGKARPAAAVLGYGLLAAALAAFPIVAPATPAAAAPVTVLANDFESGSYTPWGPRGPVTLELAADGHESATSLAVTGRTANWNGVATDATALFQAGETYSVTAFVKLPAGTAGSSSVHFTVEQTPAAGGDNQYTWIGDAVATTADGWVQIGGSYTFPDGLSAASLYVEAEGTTPFLLDDVLITGEAAVTTISAVDFEDGTTGTWSASGSPALAYVPDPDDAGNTVLSVSGRTAGYFTVQSPTGLFTEGVEYTMSARVRPASEGATRFVVKEGYHWVGNTTTPAGAWTTVTGTFTADADDTQVYIEVDPATADFLLDDILVTRPGTGTPPAGVVLSTDFEDGLDGWGLRDSSGTGATVAVTDADAHGGASSALVANRGNQGDGLGHDVTGILEPGVGYDLSAWVRFPQGAATDQVWLSLAVTNGATTSFSTLAQFEGVTNTGWTQVTASFTMPAAFDSALLYFETRYYDNDPVGTTSDFLVDDIVVEVPAPGQVQDLTPLKDTVDFPLGVAIDSRETSGSPSELLLRHFNQITAENHMKVESWYDGETFRRHPEATALLDFAQQNDLAVYGHVLVWHSQTPAWFFQNDKGVDLTTSEADKQFLRDRLRTHIFDVAASIAGDYGPYGSDTNPVTAFDVVNEVVSDAATPDGLRTSRWYEILGEEYIHLAFQYADEAFNGQYAAASVDRPVKLFINDYNTEQGGKQDQYYALVERLLAAGVPVDGVGHQFHSSLTTPPAALAQTLERFSALGLLQAVTELDATVGTPVTEAKLIEQGHWYRDAFAVFRAYQAAHGDLFSVTVWGLTDNRSWRSTQAPLLFDSALQAKYAYYGAVGDDEGVPPLITEANVFGGDVPLDATAADSVAWRNLPAEALTGGAGQFVPRWTADHLVVLATAADDAADAIAVQYGDATVTVTRDGTVSGLAGAAAVVFDDPAGWRAVVHLPHAGVVVGAQAQLDVRVLAGADVLGAWNSPGSTGTLTFLEDLSFLEVAAAEEAPVVDGVIDPVWADANVVHTGKTVDGSADGAAADVRTLWSGDDTLYVLYEVTDPVIDVAGSDPWNQDSVELFLDLGNAKSGGYGPNDAQMRISVDNVTSFGTGDAAAQAARLTSATALTATGYVVELAVKLAGESGGQNDVPLGGADTFQGLDFQVNDGRAGSRYSVHTWAEPTGTGYQTTARWGVGHLVAPAQVPAAPRITVHPQDVTGVKGGTVTLIAAADGYPAPTVQWQWRQGKGGPFHDLAGADEPTLVLSGVTSVLNARQYRAVFTNSEGTATTDVATVTVRPAKGGPAVAG